MCRRREAMSQRLTISRMPTWTTSHDELCITAGGESSIIAHLRHSVSTIAQCESFRDLLDEAGRESISIPRWSKRNAADLTTGDATMVRRNCRPAWQWQVHAA